MLLQTHDAGLTNGAQGLQKLALLPSMQFEDEAEEETKIRDLEEKIDQARRTGQSVELLVEERQHTYELWIKRLTDDLENPKEDTDLQTIRNQLERARAEYGP